MGEATPLCLQSQAKKGKKIIAVRQEHISDQLFKSLCLDANEMLRKDPRLLEQVKDLIREYLDVFSSPKKEIWETSLIEFSV